jgi:hypothetical protein
MESDWSHCRDVSANLHFPEHGAQVSEARFRAREEILYL